MRHHAHSEDFVAQVERRYLESYALVRDVLGRNALRQKHAYDMRVRPIKFTVGTWVWTYSPRRYVGRSPKWQKNYSGPFLVIKVLGPVDVILQKSRRARSFVIHVDKLKPFYGDRPPSLLPDSATTEGDTILPPDVDPPSQGETPTPAPDQPVLGPALDPARPESDEPELVEPSACSSAQQPDMESTQGIFDTETKVKVIDDDHPVVTGSSEVEPEATLTSVDDGTVAVQQRPPRARHCQTTDTSDCSSRLRPRNAS